MQSVTRPDRLTAHADIRHQFVRLAAVILAAAGWIPPVPAAAPADLDQPPAELPAAASPHGSPELLQEHLVLSSDLSRRLETAKRSLQESGQPGADTADLLRRLLDEPADVFIADRSASTVSSLRFAVQDLLKTSPPRFREYWSEVFGQVAAETLGRAIQSGDRYEIRRVALRFPFTDSGVRAAMLDIIDLQDRGALAEAHLQTEALEHLYRGERRYQSQLNQLRTALSQLTARNSSGVSQRLTKVSHTPSAPQTVSPPWPVPVWSWREWSFGGPATVGFVAEDPGIDSGLSEHPPEFSNWRPVILRDQVVFRSPFHLTGLDRTTGRPVWQLRTDTFIDMNRPSGRGNSASTSGHGMPLVHDAAITRSIAFGTISSDADYVYFIDQFESVGSQQNPLQLQRGANRRIRLPGRFFGGAQPEFPPDQPAPKHGRRIVALRFSGNSRSPQIAWTRGEDGDFPYEVRVAATEADSVTVESTHAGRHSGAASRSSSSSPLTSTAEFQSHRFLSAPAGAGQHLYLLSATADQQFINCLDRANGSLIWRQPLTWAESRAAVEYSAPDRPVGVNVCLMSGNVVVCSLASGIVLGVHPPDGTLLWATTIADPTERTALMPAMLDDLHGDPATAFLPVISDSLLISSSANSARISALDTQTGEIRWQVSRRPVRPVVFAESQDSYVVGVTGGRVILAGSRHCRALDAASGAEIWAVETNPATGRALCGATHCLVPEVDGTVAQIDIASGTARRVPAEFLPDGATLLLGSLSSDDDLVLTATPLSVTACRTAAQMRQLLEVSVNTASSPAVQRLRHAQAILLESGQADAVAVLTAGAELSDRSAAAAPLHALAAELILRDTARRIFPEQHCEPSAALHEVDRVRIQENLRTLEDLSLNSDQQLRAAVFSSVADAGRGNATGSTAESSRSPQRRPETDELLTALSEQSLAPIEIDGDWATRADLLLREESAVAPAMSAPLPGVGSTAGQRLEELAVLFPERTGTLAQRIALAEQLMREGRLAAAEAFLTTDLARRSADVPGEQLVRDTRVDLLRQIRGNVTELGAADAAAVSALNQDAVAPVVQPLSIRSGLLQESAQFRTEDSLSTELSRFRPQESSLAPDASLWMPGQQTDGTHTLGRFSLRSGSLTDEVRLPFHLQSLRTAGANELSPGLMCAAGGSSLGVVWTGRPGFARLLWSRDIRAENRFRPSAIALGPMGSDHLIWQSGTRLHCSHPLTGRDLWTRASSQSSSNPAIDVFVPEVSIFGDRSVTAVLSLDSGKYRRFRTADGRCLQSGRLTLNRSHPAIAFGSRLLYGDETSRLRMFDAVTEQDLLDSQDAIFLPSIEHPCRQVSEGRVVVVSRHQEIILIDTLKGSVVFRTSVASQMQTGFVFGFTAFERRGRLLVGLHDEQPFGTTYQAESRLGEPQVEFGSLFCLNPQTGQLLWDGRGRRTEPSVLPPIAGDPSDLLIAWSWVGIEPDRRFRQASRRLRVQVIDLLSGELLAENSDFPPAFPLRCVHDADRRETVLYCHGSVIRWTE